MTTSSLTDVAYSEALGLTVTDPERVRLSSDKQVWRSLLLGHISSAERAYRGHQRSYKQELQMYEDDPQFQMVVERKWHHRLKKSGLDLQKLRRRLVDVDRMIVMSDVNHPDRAQALDFLREVILKHQELKGHAADWIDRAMYDAISGLPTIFERQ